MSVAEVLLVGTHIMLGRGARSDVTGGDSGTPGAKSMVTRRCRGGVAAGKPCCEKKVDATRGREGDGKSGVLLREVKLLLVLRRSETSEAVAAGEGALRTWSVVS